MNKQTSEKIRHVVSLSGGKDSSALAIYLRDRIPDVEYIFCDTGEELLETYDYLDQLEVYLGKEIKRLRPRQTFEELLLMKGGYLPSSQVRWCTENLKIKPFEEAIGDDICHNYIGIRADEPHRKGYISAKRNIIPHYPFVEDGIMKEDVIRILEDSGLGLPKYYEWRSRSGCYFCFFQQRIEWVGLLNNHEELFNKAESFEKEDTVTGNRYTWSLQESLKELRNPERQLQIKEEYQKRQGQTDKFKPNRSLADVFLEDEPSDGCLICYL